MTLCIAVKCVHDSQPAIVMVSDLRIEDDAAGSETAIKQGRLKHGWQFMYAGIQPRAVQLYKSARDHVLDKPLGSVGTSSILREAVRKHREMLVDDYIHSQIARSYEWLLESGHEVLPTEYYSQLIHFVAGVRFDAQLILCGIDDGVSLIFVIDESRGEPISKPVENFAAIGSGSMIAESVLHQRSHRSEMPLKMAIYHALEAKRLGESAPGVGSRTTTTILLPGGKLAYPTNECTDCMESLIQQYAPKALDSFGEDWEQMPEEFLTVQEDLRDPEPTTTDSPRQRPLRGRRAKSDES